MEAASKSADPLLQNELNHDNPSRAASSLSTGVCSRGLRGAFGGGFARHIPKSSFLPLSVKYT